MQRNKLREEEDSKATDFSGEQNASIRLREKVRRLRPGYAADPHSDPIVGQVIEPDRQDGNGEGFVTVFYKYTVLEV